MDLSKEDFIEKFMSVPKRKMTDMEKQMIFIIVEKARLQRESSMSIVNKGFIIFFIFLALVYFGKLNDIVSSIYLNILFILGVLVLLSSLYTYFSVIRKEEKTLDRLLDMYLK